MAKAPHLKDIEVGQRLRRRRTLLGMSQEQLGERLGVSYQQIQKYERGTNRIGSSRLHELGRILKVPVAFFFEEEEKADAGGWPTSSMAAGLAEGAPTAFIHERPSGGGTEPADVASRETLELVRAFNRIDDPLVRRRLYELARALADLAYRPTAAGS